MKIASSKKNLACRRLLPRRLFAKLKPETGFIGLFDVSRLRVRMVRVLAQDEFCLLPWLVITSVSEAARRFIMIASVLCSDVRW